MDLYFITNFLELAFSYENLKIFITGTGLLSLVFPRSPSPCLKLSCSKSLKDYLTAFKLASLEET